MFFQTKEWLKGEWDQASKTLTISVDKQKVRKDETIQAIMQFGDQYFQFQGSVTFKLTVSCRKAGGECIEKDEEKPKESAEDEPTDAEKETEESREDELTDAENDNVTEGDSSAEQD